MTYSICKTALLGVLGGLPLMQSAKAQTLLNYDDLSFFEEGSAFDVGDATLSFNTLLDQAYIENPPKLANRHKTTLQFAVSVAREADNGWNVGLQYTGVFDPDDDGNDTHRYAAFAEAPWGRFSIGRVTGLMEDAIARKTRVGNASLTFGRGLGGMDETGLHFRHAVNAYEVHVTVDQNGDVQGGLLFEAPIGVGAHAVGFRGGTGNLQERSPGLGTGDVEEAAAFYSYTIGSLSLGVEIGIQDIAIDGAVGRNTQRFASLGASYKTGRSSFSAEYGRSDFLGRTGDSMALGARYDFARGLSGNLGVNYADNGVLDAWRVPISIRYEF